MAGRKSKYTPETVKKITDALKIGATRTASVGAAGISYETFCQWMNPNSEYYQSEFSELVTRAEHEAELRYTQRLAQEANKRDGDWRAAESWLKRRRRDDWHEKVANEQSGTLKHEHINADEDAILAAAEEIRFRRLVGDISENEPSGLHESDVS